MCIVALDKMYYGSSIHGFLEILYLKYLRCRMALWPYVQREA